MLAVIRGAGDLASGIALRLYHSGFDVVMTDLAAPMAIRRTVAFSEAVVHGVTTVEDITARRVETVQEAKACCAAGEIPVLVDPEAAASRAATHIESAPRTGRMLPERESSPTRHIRERSQRRSIMPAHRKIPAKIATSKPEPSFLRLAGAKFTVRESEGKR